PFAMVNCVPGDKIEFTWSKHADIEDRKSKRLREDNSAVMFICDIFAMDKLINRYNVDYLFIGDELTKDADIHDGDFEYSIHTIAFVQIMNMIKKRAILFSSTLPKYTDIPEFYDAIVKKHSGMKLESFSASRVKIGCSIITSNYGLYTPYSNVKTVEELKSV